MLYSLYITIDIPHINRRKVVIWRAVNTHTYTHTHTVQYCASVNLNAVFFEVICASTLGEATLSSVFERPHVGGQQRHAVRESPQ